MSETDGESMEVALNLHQDPWWQHRPYLYVVTDAEMAWIHNPQIAARVKAREEARRNDLFGGQRPITQPVADYVPGPRPSLAQRTVSALGPWIVGVAGVAIVVALFLGFLFALVLVAGLIGG